MVKKLTPPDKKEQRAVPVFLTTSRHSRKANNTSRSANSCGPGLEEFSVAGHAWRNITILWLLHLNQIQDCINNYCIILYTFSISWVSWYVYSQDSLQLARFGQFHRQARRETKVERARLRTVRKRPSEASRIVDARFWSNGYVSMRFRTSENEAGSLQKNEHSFRCFYESEWSEIGSVGLVPTLRHPKGGPWAEFLLHTPGVHSSSHSSPHWADSSHALW
jgi:hypothetical protein